MLVCDGSGTAGRKLGILPRTQTVHKKLKDMLLLVIILLRLSSIFSSSDALYLSTSYFVSPVHDDFRVKRDNRGVTNAHLICVGGP